tara:strand:+ start:193 stop:411 length:219 start_codon:yes stop_codon:yes gene_type:complete
MRKIKVLCPKAVQWAIANDFYIYPVTEDNLIYNIIVEKGNKKAMLQEKYNKKTVHEGIAEVYSKLYKKHNTK